MARIWTREFLTRRIDRCYLIASWAKMPERREFYLKLARRYRELLAGFAPGHMAIPVAPRSMLCQS